MIEIIEISKKYKNRYVLNNITISIPEKGCIGFVGPNGCGKTILLNIICGFIKPTTGKIIINNKEYTKKREFIENAGIVINNPEFINDLTLEENLFEIAKILDLTDTNENIERLLKLFELYGHKDKKYKETSLGMKQKMRLIQAFMENKDIYIFDEPTNALDKKSIETVREIILKLKKKCLVIVTSHNQSDIELLCDKVYNMYEGEII